MCSFLCIPFDSFSTRLSFLVLLNPLVFTILPFPIMLVFLSLLFLRCFSSLFPPSPPSFLMERITKARFLRFFFTWCRMSLLLLVIVSTASVMGLLIGLLQGSRGRLCTRFLQASTRTRCSAQRCRRSPRHGK